MKKTPIDALNIDIKYLEILFNELIDGFFLTDETGKILFVNDAYLRLTGLNREDAVGNTVHKMLETGIMTESSCAETLKTKKSVSTINRYYSGKRCMVSASPIFDESGNLIMTVANVRDISELDRLQKSIENEKEKSKEFERRLREKEQDDSPSDFHTKSRKLAHIIAQIQNTKDTDSTILITGETGTGKDHLAEYIHSISTKSQKGKLVKINCGAIPDNLLESELFGYEPGAFTGAKQGGNIGLLEAANGGTLFIDEIGDMSYHLQVKLLNALQDKEVYRLGGNEPIPFDARIISATNADLETLVKEKKFRMDLYYRLNVINIKMPALRERKEDIIPLAIRFLDEFNDRYKRSRYFDDEVLPMLISYSWPGNIRELKNLIERLVATSKTEKISIDEFDESLLSPQLFSETHPKKIFAYNEGDSLTASVQAFEKFALKEELDSGLPLKEIAGKLGIDISTLVRKKRKYNL